MYSNTLNLLLPFSIINWRTDYCLSINEAKYCTPALALVQVVSMPIANYNKLSHFEVAN